MTQISYKTKGVCSRQIDLEIENDIIVGAKFIGGCRAVYDDGLM